MADQSIAMQTGATLQGRVLARIGLVSMDHNVITTRCASPLIWRRTTPPDRRPAVLPGAPATPPATPPAARTVALAAERRRWRHHRRHHRHGRRPGSPGSGGCGRHRRGRSCRLGVHGLRRLVARSRLRWPRAGRTSQTPTHVTTNELTQDRVRRRRVWLLVAGAAALVAVAFAAVALLGGSGSDARSPRAGAGPTSSFHAGPSGQGRGPDDAGVRAGQAADPRDSRRLETDGSRAAEGRDARGAAWGVPSWLVQGRSDSG